MEITLYNFVKRRNSTKRPSKGETINVNLKEGCSHYNPSFILNTNPTNYSYLSWGTWYYYITDIVNTRNGVWTISCELDPLATWKNDIKSTTAFVLYSTSNYNTDLIDPRLSSAKNTIINTSNANLSFIATPQPRYIISYVGTHSNPYVAVTDTQLAKIMSKMSDNAFAELFTDPNNAISKMLTDTGSCITSCIYNPCTIVGAISEIIFAGGYNTGVVGNAVNRDATGSVSITIPWNFSDFRNRSQFTSLLLYLPAYGWLELNADNFQGKSSINIKMTLDSVVGEICYIVENQARCVAQMGVPIQISTVTQGNPLGAIGNVVAGSIAGLMGNYAGAGVSAFNAITSAIGTNVGSVGGSGGNTSYISKKNITLVCISHNTNVDPSSLANNYGRPCNKVLSLSGLSGYVQTTNANVSTWAPKQYKDEIDALLNGGVYLE